MKPEMTAEERIDGNVTRMLKAAGNPKLSAYMPDTQTRLRETMRSIMGESYIAGSNACHEVMRKVYGSGK